MKTLRCQDAGFDCPHVIVAETEEQVLQQVAEHTRAVHQVELTPELAEQVRPLIHQEPLTD